MGALMNQISEWLKSLLIEGIKGNLGGMFDTTNQKVAEISAQVGTTPQAWNNGIFNMVQTLSETVIVPIAGAILAFVMTLELIQLLAEKNNLGDVDTWMFTRFFNAKGFRTRDLEAAYKSNFGGEPLQAVPNMAIYGYDTGLYLLHSLGVDGIIDEETPQYRGIQTSYRWERGDNWSGYTNQAIEFIHFSPDHQITVNVK